jgi:hypothetical protein
MEPITTIDGFNMMQNSRESRSLLNEYYRQQGYEVVTPKAHAAEEEQNAKKEQNKDQPKNH